MTTRGPAIVGELIAVGRGVAARPAFEAGPVLGVGRHARGGAGIGDLVLARQVGAGAQVVERLGRADLPADAMGALALDAHLARRFRDDVLAEAEARAADADAPDPGRRDLRGQRVITIDPEGAKDHDDAIAVARDGDAIRLWVHIADVARYVAPGGTIDREAARRGTSVYLPGMVVPMLPPRLSNDVCSLRPGVDRKVLTAEILVGADGGVRETAFHRALVRSEARLTYPQVDACFAGTPLGDAGLEADLALARELAEGLRAARMARGALEIVSGEPRFRFEAGRVVEAVRETQTPSHSLVEECMIAANEAVARALIAAGRPTVFRVHPHPEPRAVERLYVRLEAVGVPLPPLPEGPLTPDQCAEAARAAAAAVARHVERGGAGGRALPALVLRALQRAHYDIGPPGHSGLASPAYLHFTSPIRRYPDLLAHRTLLASLGLEDHAPGAVELAGAAADSSDREREAQDLERRGDRICLAFLLRDRLERDGWDLEMEGEITGIVPGGCFLEFPPINGGFLPARSVADDDWRVDDAEVTLVGARTGRRLRLGDRVAVRVRDIEPLRGRVTLEPAAGAAPTPGAAPARSRTRPRQPPRIARRRP